MNDDSTPSEASTPPEPDPPAGIPAWSAASPPDPTALVSPTTGGLPLYTPPPPPPPTTSARRHSPIKVVGLVVGMMALLGATVFAVTALDQPDGASSPEAAVHHLFDAISHRDALGVIESLPANERAVLRQPAIDITQELQRLGLLSSFSLNDVPGAQLSVDDLQLTSDDLGPGVVRVNVVGGTISGHTIASELPIGSRLHSIMQQNAKEEAQADGSDSSSSSSGEPTSSSFAGDLRDSHLALVTVKDGGGWHVSLGYTIANAIHGDSSTPPDFAAAPTPVGSDSPDGAVRDLVDAAVSLDARKVVSLMAPDEDKALYAYASLFLPSVSSTAHSHDATIKVNHLDLSVAGSGSTRRVHIGGVSATFADQDETTAISYDGRCFSSQLTYKSAAVGIGGTDEIKSDEADDAEYDDPSDPDDVPLTQDPDFLSEEAQARAEAQKPQKSCQGEDPTKTDDDGELGPLGVLGTAVGQFAVTVVQVNGRWYVSPVRTLLDTVVASLQQLKPSDVDKWGNWFSDDFGTTCEAIGSGVSSDGVTTPTTAAPGPGSSGSSDSSDCLGSSGGLSTGLSGGSDFAPVTPSGGSGTDSNTPQVITLPDGTKLNPDGSIVEPDGTVVQTGTPAWTQEMQRIGQEMGSPGTGDDSSGSPVGPTSTSTSMPAPTTTVTAPAAPLPSSTTSSTTAGA